MFHKKDSIYSSVFEQYQVLTRHLIKGLISSDIDVSISVYQKQGTIHIDIELPNEFRGNIIGKGGRIARAIRTLLEVAPFESPHQLLVTIVN